MAPRLTTPAEQEGLGSSTKEPHSTNHGIGDFIASFLLIFGGFALLMVAFGITVLVGNFPDPPGRDGGLGTSEAHRDFFINFVFGSLVLTVLTLVPGIFHFWNRKNPGRFKKLILQFGEKDWHLPRPGGGS